MELEPKAYANAYAKPTQNIRGGWLSFGVKMWLSFKQIVLHSIFGGFTYWSNVLQLQLNTRQEQLNMLLHLPTRNAYATLPTPNDYAMPPPKLNGLRNY